MNVRAPALVLAGLLVAVPLRAQDNPCAAVAEQIANAESAAPASVSAKATVMDMEGNVLREGSNRWTCIPAEEPMCVDEQWLGWMKAYMAKTEPTVTATGHAYMLNCCSIAMSNTDPFATEETADNEWLAPGGPHIMVIVPDPALLEGLPTHPDAGGPWVMWRDTPYAHIMVPVAD